MRVESEFGICSRCLATHLAAGSIAQALCRDERVAPVVRVLNLVPIERIIAIRLRWPEVRGGN